MFRNPSGILSSRHLKSSDVARILSAQGPAVALTDSVAVRTSPLTVVGGETLAPGGGVHAAVGTLRSSVLAQDVGVEEVAGVIGSIAARVLVRVLVGGDTSTGALARVVGTGVVSRSHVTTRSLNSTCELGRSVERAASRGVGKLVETHGAGDDDLEVVAPLSVVGGSGGINLRTPQRALRVVSLMSNRR